MKKLSLNLLLAAMMMSAYAAPDVFEIVSVSIYDSPAQVEQRYKNALLQAGGQDKMAIEKAYAQLKNPADRRTKMYHIAKDIVDGRIKTHPRISLDEAKKIVLAIDNARHRLSVSVIDSNATIQKAYDKYRKMSTVKNDAEKVEQATIAYTILTEPWLLNKFEFDPFENKFKKIAVLNGNTSIKSPQQEQKPEQKPQESIKEEKLVTINTPEYSSPYYKIGQDMLTVSTNPIASTLKAPKSWTFEYKNKTKYPVWIQLFYADRSEGLLDKTEYKVNAAKGSKESDQGYLRITGIDPKKQLEIYTFTDDISNVDGYTIKDNYRNITQEPVIYIAPSDSSREGIFVSWEKNALRPQSGSKGKTQSGLPIKNNVKKLIKQ